MAGIRTRVTRTHHTCGFPGRLKKAMERARISNVALAEELDRSEGCIRKWLRADSEPVLTDLSLLATALKVPVEYLVFGTRNRAPLAELRRAVAFYDEALADPKGRAVGAVRDAHEWIINAARKVAVEPHLPD